MLTVSLQKTKFMVVEREIEVEDMALIAVEGEVIEYVEDFCYLGTVLVQLTKRSTEGFLMHPRHLVH